MAVRAEESGGMSTPLLCYLKWTQLHYFATWNGQVTFLKSDQICMSHSTPCSARKS